MDDAEEYGAMVDALVEKATHNLRAACGDPGRLREAIAEYLSEGYQREVSSGELTDYFCVSTPNIVEEAGYLGDETYAVVKIFDDVHNQILRSKGGR